MVKPKNIDWVKPLLKYSKFNKAWWSRDIESPVVEAPIRFAADLIKKGRDPAKNIAFLHGQFVVFAEPTPEGTDARRTKLGTFDEDDFLTRKRSEYLNESAKVRQEYLLSFLPSGIPRSKYYVSPEVVLRYTRFD